jgi:DNA-binding NtrC family response regulator
LGGRILLVDDEPGVRFGLRSFLTDRGYEADEAGTVAEALERLLALPYAAAVVDYRLPDGTALDLLLGLKQAHQRVPVVILTAFGSIDLAVHAIQEGAEHFLTKPVELPTLAVILERAIENQRNRQKQAAGQATASRRPLDPFVGESPAIRELALLAAKVVGSDSPLLIQGETGSGKGVLAAWLHAKGPRGEEPFVDLNCAGLARELVESELFGHVKGAFTGAAATKVGLLEVAHRGTVFLDEIGDLDLAVQPKLLKVLEEKRFRRVGDVRDRTVDIRLISATHRDLAALVRERSFRSDLYFRLAAIPLVIPPLRERLEDLPVLVEGLLERLRAELGRGEVELRPGAVAALAEYPWPGNLRELRNVLERAILLSEGPSVDRQDLRFGPAGAVAAEPMESRLTLEELERRHIERVLAEERGRVASAAKRLGVARSSLYDRLKRLGIRLSDS